MSRLFPFAGGFGPLYKESSVILFVENQKRRNIWDNFDEFSGNSPQAVVETTFLDS
jgi:hypothetical protein